MFYFAPIFMYLYGYSNGDAKGMEPPRLNEKKTRGSYIRQYLLMFGYDYQFIDIGNHPNYKLHPQERHI